MKKTLALRQVKLLGQFVQGNRVLYLGAVLCIGLATASGLIGPLVLRTTIDSIIGDEPMAQIFGWLHAMIRFVGVIFSSAAAADQR